MLLPCTNPTVIPFAFRISFKSQPGIQSFDDLVPAYLSLQSLLTQFFLSLLRLAILKYYSSQNSRQFLLHTTLSTVKGKLPFVCIWSHRLCLYRPPVLASAQPLAHHVQSICFQVSLSLTALGVAHVWRVCPRLISAQQQAWCRVGSQWVFFEWINKSCKKKLNSPRRF